MATSPPTALIQHLRQTLLAGDTHGQSDAQLMESFINLKDEAAFRSLVQRHGPMVLAVCRRLLRNHHDAEDAFQATFLVLVRKAAMVRPREMVANWLHGVAYNTALKARAIAAKRQVCEQQVSEMPQHEAAQQDQGLWLDLKPILDKELARLPAKYRLPIVLCDLEGKSIHEATHQLNWPQGTLAGRLARGRALLARRLARYGLSLSAGSLATVLSQNTASASLSSSVVTATVQSAMAFAFNKTAIPGVVSSHVAMLTNGGLKSMSMTKITMVAAALFAVTLTAVGVGVSLFGSEVQTPDKVPAPLAKEAERESKTEKDQLQVAFVIADKNILQNSGIEEGKESPAHWSQGAEIDGVEYSWDKKAGYKSKASLCLHKTANRYFPIAQWYQIVDRETDSPEIRLSAQVKAEKVTKAILDVIFLDDKEESISHEWAAYIGAKKSGDPPANHDWKEYSGQVKIPKGTKKIQVGLQIYGPGKVWFDEVRAEYVKPRIMVEFRRAEKRPAEGLTESTVAGTKDKIYVHKTADITTQDIAEARSVEDDGFGMPAIGITFTNEGAKKMLKLSEQQKGKPLAILVDGKVISAPIVQARMFDRVQITGRFTKEEVDKLVNGINGK